MRTLRQGVSFRRFLLNPPFKQNDSRTLNYTNAPVSSADAPRGVSMCDAALDDSAVCAAHVYALPYLRRGRRSKMEEALFTWVINASRACVIPALHIPAISWRCEGGIVCFAAWGRRGCARPCRHYCCHHLFIR